MRTFTHKVLPDLQRTDVSLSDHLITSAVNTDSVLTRKLAGQHVYVNEKTLFQHFDVRFIAIKRCTAFHKLKSQSLLSYFSTR